MERIKTYGLPSAPRTSPLISHCGNRTCYMIMYVSWSSTPASTATWGFRALVAESGSVKCRTILSRNVVNKVVSAKEIRPMCGSSFKVVCVCYKEYRTGSCILGPRRDGSHVRCDVIHPLVWRCSDMKHLERKAWEPGGASKGQRIAPLSHFIQKFKT
ncbi:uncharacterized protein MYCFIDRAFT_206115 [Pseudocercospora fijiensis CIRAD86]|uniref:Uncharacterized protein n=1 Tax=Pseudocercospora fijiensis (strain CIRAD86) TaxID=383855 RepID=N1QAC0_PSEFD|nr:uncharacterized protein MYCFIDRAFT_206115 [Pseudocercospora fijiensis CIRAD86]EME88756.1 hypothetical protein MYCFIDRAFT_206115 [Pseudocercospora fijiensis CIRAD86]